MTNEKHSICLECGTCEQDSMTGYCINDHDNWVEPIDDINRFIELAEKFDVQLHDIKKSIETGEALVDFTTFQRQLISKIQKASEYISSKRESQANCVVVSHEYLRTVMKNNNLSSEKEAEQLLINVLAGEKVMYHE